MQFLNKSIRIKTRNILAMVIVGTLTACGAAPKTTLNVAMAELMKLPADKRPANSNSGILVRTDTFDSYVRWNKSGNATAITILNANPHPRFWYSFGQSSRENLFENCEENDNFNCVLIYEWDIQAKNWKIPNDVEKAFADYQEKKRLAAEEEKRLLEIAKLEAEQKEIERRQNTCTSFGFTIGNEAMAKCVFELFKLEQATAENDRLIKNINDNAAAQRLLAEKQLKEQEFNNGMMLLQQSQQILNQTYSSPTIKCKHNKLLNTTTCY